MDFLTQQTKQVLGNEIPDAISATGKHVIVVGGGDTGSDCIGTSKRQGAASITQLEIMPKPPEKEDKSMTWPYWPLKLRTSSSQEEGCERDWSVSTKSIEADENGNATKINLVRLDAKMQEIPGSEFELQN